MSNRVLERVATVEAPHSEAAAYQLEYGDVLMNEGGDIDKPGRGCVWWQEVHPCLHQNHVFAVRPFAVTSEWQGIASINALFHQSQLQYDDHFQVLLISSTTLSRLVYQSLRRTRNAVERDAVERHEVECSDETDMDRDCFMYLPSLKHSADMSYGK